MKYYYHKKDKTRQCDSNGKERATYAQPLEENFQDLCLQVYVENT